MANVSTIMCCDHASELATMPTTTMPTPTCCGKSFRTNRSRLEQTRHSATVPLSAALGWRNTLLVYGLLSVALTIAWAITAAILLSSTVLFQVLRERGLIALERLMGMLLVMVAVQMLLNGVETFLAR